MSDTQDKAALAEVQSYLHWWHLAGVDVDYVTDARPWLDADLDSDAAPETSAPSPHRSDTPAEKSARSPVPSALPPANVPDLPPLPKSRDEFVRYWMEEPGLALPSGTGRRAAPHGPLQPGLMIIADMPDMDDTDLLLTGVAGDLLKKILCAADIDPAKVYHASLLPEHSLEPGIDPAILSVFGNILSAHIGLVRPQTVMLLGEMPNSALTQNDLPKNRLNLRFINHELGEIGAASSFHPRTLLQRPVLKARAWQDWQWLMESMT